MHYVQYAHAYCGNHPQRRRRASLQISMVCRALRRELIKRLAELPALAADAAEKRGLQVRSTRSASPTTFTVSTTSTAFESDQEAFARALPRDAE